MAVDLEFDRIQVTAGADLITTGPTGVQFKAVTLAGLVAATPLLAAGILRHGAKSGEILSVGYAGVMKAYFGAAVNTVGYPLTVTTSGFIIAAASGGACIGRSRTTVASGELATALFDFKNLGYSTVA